MRLSRKRLLDGELGDVAVTAEDLQGIAGLAEALFSEKRLDDRGQQRRRWVVPIQQVRRPVTDSAHALAGGAQLQQYTPHGRVIADRIGRLGRHFFRPDRRAHLHTVGGVLAGVLPRRLGMPQALQAHV